MANMLKTVAASFRLAMIMWIAEPSWLIPNLIAPFVFTTVALVLFRGVGGSFGLYAVLGGGMMGMWGNVLYSSGFAIEAERHWMGTIEYTMATPTRFINVILGRSVANALMGLVNIVLMLVIAQFGFQIPLGLANPAGFAVALLMTLISLSSLGLIFASAFTLSRSAQVATNGLEFPLYVVSGAMFPVALLPFFVHPVSYALGPTWGVEAIRMSATNAALSPQFFMDVGVTVLSAFIYFGLALLLFMEVERKMRKEGLLART